MIEAKPYRMKNRVMHYAWGARNAEAFIPKLLGEAIESDKPYAELWLGAHDKAPSLIQINDTWQPLNTLIQQHPEEMAGEKVLSRFGKKLPFLLKVLSAGEALSIQTHPNKAQAEQLHGKDPEHYPDDNHKPEISIALEPFAAMVGFQSHPNLVKMFNAYPEIAGLIDDSLLKSFLNSGSEKQSEHLQSVYQNLMETDPERLAKAVNTLAGRLEASSQKSEQDMFFLDLLPKYGSQDVGLFTIYFLNLVHLEPGEAMYLKAGIPHAYVKGNIIECMANSDNVVRAGLTPKFKDVETLVRILTWEMHDMELLGESVRANEIKYAPDVDAFEVYKYRIGNGQSVQISQNEGPAILLLIEGEVSLQFGENQSQVIHAGESFFIPACLLEYHVEGLNERSLLFRAIVP